MEWYIKLHRRVEDSEIWNKPAEWLKVWIYLLNNVNFKDNRDFKRWENWFKYDTIANSCKCKYKTVENCIKFLKDRGQINVKKSWRGAIISVINYDKYQYIEDWQGIERELKGNWKGTIKEEWNNERNNNYFYETFLEDENNKNTARFMILETFKKLHYVPSKNETMETFLEWTETIYKKYHLDKARLEEKLKEFSIWWLEARTPQQLCKKKWKSTFTNFLKNRQKEEIMTPMDKKIKFQKEPLRSVLLKRQKQYTEKWQEMTLNQIETFIKEYNNLKRKKETV